jgi:hypothetical protein
VKKYPMMPTAVRSAPKMIVSLAICVSPECRQRLATADSCLGS